MVSANDVCHRFHRVLGHAGPCLDIGRDRTGELLTLVVLLGGRAFRLELLVRLLVRLQAFLHLRQQLLLLPLLPRGEPCRIERDGTIGLREHELRFLRFGRLGLPLGQRAGR